MRKLVFQKKINRPPVFLNYSKVKKIILLIEVDCPILLEQSQRYSAIIQKEYPSVLLQKILVADEKRFALSGNDYFILFDTKDQQFFFPFRAIEEKKTQLSLEKFDLAIDFSSAENFFCKAIFAQIIAHFKVGLYTTDWKELYDFCVELTTENHNQYSHWLHHYISYLNNEKN